MAASNPLTYRDAGVDIDAQDEALRQAKAAIRSTFTPGVLGDVGAFGGLFDLGRADCGSGILVASADGVGTKIAVARRVGRYDTVGRDLVNHCINDILVQGAKPLFFMDYVGVGRLDPEVVSALIGGCAASCRENSVALLGGETAEMPGTYGQGDFDLVGFIVGVVERERLLDGSRVQPGQVLLGLTSSGLHTNGYSLARRVLFEELGLEPESTPAELGGSSVADALLQTHRCYFPLLWPLLERGQIEAMAHITGGGLPGNVPRVLRDVDAVCDRSSWTPPGLFKLLVEGGATDHDEAYRVYNMGIGMVLAVDPSNEAAVREHLVAAGEEVVAIGRTESGSGTLRWEGECSF